jgi:hypothetical protein
VDVGCRHEYLNPLAGKVAVARQVSVDTLTLSSGTLDAVVLVVGFTTLILEYLNQGQGLGVRCGRHRSMCTESRQTVK